MTKQTDGTEAWDEGPTIVDGIPILPPVEALSLCTKEDLFYAMNQIGSPWDEASPRGTQKA